MKAIKAYESWNNEEVKEVAFWRASRWISIKSNYNPNRRNGLWDYVTDGRGYSVNDDNCDFKDLYLHYFTWNGRNYAINEFVAIGSAWDALGHEIYYKEGGDYKRITAVDWGGNLYNPIYIEFDEYCERVRVYEKVHTDNFYTTPDLMEWARRYSKSV